MLNSFIQRRSVTLLALGLSASFFTATQSRAQDVDVAIDASTGLNFVARHTLSVESPEGVVVILKDQDPSYKQVVQVSHLSPWLALGHLEIELVSPRELLYLSEMGNRWELGKIELSADGVWSKAPTLESMTGNGFASNLSALPDGRFSILVGDSSLDRNASLFLVDRPEVSRALAQLETIPASKLMSAGSGGDGPGEAVTNSNDEATGFTQGLGFGAGLQSGIGIAYRRYLTENWGMQITGIPYWSQNNVWANLGVTLMRILHKTSWTRFYAIAGVSTFYNGQNAQDFGTCPAADPKGADPTAPCNPPSTWKNQYSINFGMGIGFEMLFKSNLGLALELPVTAAFDATGGTFKLNQIMPIPNGALVYYF
jgi:hypothetical protein